MVIRRTGIFQGIGNFVLSVVSGGLPSFTPTCNSNGDIIIGRN